jgi:periplasmic divalent cation tolerance protein
MSDTVTILCTCPDESTGERLARGLVENRHAACVNLLPGIRSIYAWRGEIQDEREVLLVIKTTGSHVFLIERWLTEHHPYEVPELIALRNEHVSDAYLRWLRESVAA